MGTDRFTCTVIPETDLHPCPASPIADVIRALRSEQPTARDAGVALLRCPHIDQPPLDVTWFCGECSCCNLPVQIPKATYFDLVGAGKKVSIVCFECWTDREETAS